MYFYLESKRLKNKFFKILNSDFHPFPLIFSKFTWVIDIFRLVKLHQKYTFFTCLLMLDSSYSSKYERKGAQKQGFWILNPYQIFEGGNFYIIS